MIKNHLEAKVKTVQDDGTFEVIASTGKEDRYGDTIDPNGWYLKNYKKNPVILWSHSTGSFGGMAIPPVARALKVWVEASKELRLKGQFAMTAFAQELQALVKGKFLSALSVGFLPLVEDIKGAIEIGQKMYRRITEGELKCYVEKGFVKIEERLYGKGGEHFSKQELLEVSWVSVPALPQALVQAKAMKLELVAKAIEEEIEEEKTVQENKNNIEGTEEEIEKETEEPTDKELEEEKEEEEKVEDKEESKTFEERLSEAEKLINELREAIIPESVTLSKDETKGRKALTKKKSKKSEAERLLIMFDKVFETLLRKLRQND